MFCSHPQVLDVNRAFFCLADSGKIGLRFSVPLLVEESARL